MVRAVQRLDKLFRNAANDSNAIGNYSGTPSVFFIQPPAGVIYEVHRVIIRVGDGNGYTAQEFGNLGVALTNGVNVYIMDADQTNYTYDFLDGVPIKDNEDFLRLTPDYKFQSLGDEFIVFDWNFVADCGLPLTITENDSLGFLLNDNLSSLTEFRMVAKGLQRTEGKPVGVDDPEFVETSTALPV